MGATHPLSVTFKVTDFVPAVLHDTVCGPTVVAVAGVAPAPKFHAYVAVPEAVPVNVNELD